MLLEAICELKCVCALERSLLLARLLHTIDTIDRAHFVRPCGNSAPNGQDYTTTDVPGQGTTIYSINNKTYL